MSTSRRIVSANATIGPVAPVATGRVEIQVRRLGGNDLVRDYIAGSSKLAPFFSGHPFDPEAYRRKAKEVAARLPRSEREAARRAIRPTSRTAADRVARVLAGEGVFVTTGQQTGLFGGPLFTVYKMLSAARLARSLEPILDCPVVPLFWIAADDHDWAEVDHTFVLSPQNELRRIALPEPLDSTPHPMSRRILADDVEAAVAEFTALLPDTEFAPPLRDMLARAYRPGRSMAAAFEELYARLFSSLDVALVNSAHDGVKVAAKPVVRRELERAEAHANRLVHQSERLAGQGYHNQVTISTDAANVLVHDGHGRDRLVREDGAWMLRRTRVRLSDSDLFAMLESNPESFSPNVLLRPVVESALFPTVAYVAGPSEVSYFAQIGCLFEAHGIQAPVVFPRFSVTLIESKVRKVLDRSGLVAEELAHPFHEVATRFVREEMPDEVRRALELLRADTRGDYDLLAEAAKPIDPTLIGWLEGVRNGALAQTDAAEKKIASHLKKKNEIVLEQLRKAAVNLYPEGVPQERRLNAFPYLARYGPELLLELLEAMEPEIESPAAAWTGVRC